MLHMRLYGSLNCFQTGIVKTGLFSKQAYFRVIFSARNRGLIFKTGLLLNPANFQGFRVFYQLVFSMQNLKREITQIFFFQKSVFLF